MVKDAWYFLIPLLALAALCYFAGPAWSVFPFLAAALFVAWFFRNPQRTIPQDPSAVVSPADGKVIQICKDGQDQRLSIFLSVFDVHVNRAPIEGRIESQEYRKGQFLLAFDERASVENEQLAVTIADEERRLRFSLIAGLVARRIVAWKKKGDRVAKGDRIGLIRFGSRVDLYLPAGCKPVVKPGDRVRGGASVIARWE